MYKVTAWYFINDFNFKPDVEQNEAIPLKERNTRISEPERNRIRFSFTPSMNVRCWSFNELKFDLKLNEYYIADKKRAKE